MVCPEMHQSACGRPPPPLYQLSLQGKAPSGRQCAYDHRQEEENGSSSVLGHACGRGLASSSLAASASPRDWVEMTKGKRNREGDVVKPSS